MSAEEQKPLRISKREFGEYSKVVFVPHSNCRDLVCKHKSEGHPRKVLLWFVYQDGKRMEERVGLCFICKKLYVILGKD